ncbi:uncharacterized protein LOC120388865 [Mauremys reevesii]|uniref:uncharacterized protein LOC120388865 n=1 Tax=Mauremys reevesii TaxID=260615 RepID=UPI00193ED693|nr:uncharacterized protein LOC120388865 [Mauremys reevesii]
METMVSGRMPRAGLLLLPLLLCFGPETVGSINPSALRETVDHVDKDGLAVEYAFAVSLQKASCENPSGLEQVLRRNKLRDMQAAINPEGVLYDPDEGPIVAARMQRLGRAGEHAELRLLQGDRNSPVQKLLARTYNERSCLIFFTVRSPCAGTCLLVKRPHNILQMVSDTFRPIDHNYKAFIFRQIYRQDRDLDPQSLLEAWHQLPNVPLLRCDTNGCRDCRGNDPKTDPNTCLDEIRAMRQPLHPSGRGQKEEQGAEGRCGRPRSLPGSAPFIGPGLAPTFCLGLPLSPDPWQSHPLGSEAGQPLPDTQLAMDEPGHRLPSTGEVEVDS